MLLAISAVDTANQYFQVIGDVTDTVAADDYLQVQKSTGNNGIYQLASVVYNSGYTQLTTVEAIPSSVADGSISFGVYALRFYQPDLPGKEELVIPPYGVDTTTSLKFNGKATLNYGEWQQQNVLLLLENFASDQPPVNPTTGQVWYDNDNQVLRTRIGSDWSTDVNVEDGLVTFKDPQHPTANTKYVMTAAEPSGLEGSGVTLYPEANPEAGDAMFRICDEAGSEVFVVQYDGKTTTSNALEVTAAGVSDVSGALAVNSSNTGTTGLTVSKSIDVVGGDLFVTTGRSLRVVGGASVVVGTGVILRGSSATAGTTIQSSGGTAVATYGDAAIVFSVATTIPNLISTAITTETINITDSAAVVDLTVTGTTELATTQATDLTADSVTVTGLTTLDAATVSAVPADDADVVNKLYVDQQVGAAEPAIPAGEITQVLLGDKSWADINPLVIESVLTGFDALEDATPVAETDTVLQSISKLSLGKQDALESSVSIKTINGDDILGSGDLDVTGGSVMTPSSVEGVLDLSGSFIGMDTFNVTLVENITSIILPVGLPSKRIDAFIRFKQDSTGGWTVALTDIAWRSTPPEVALDPDAVTWIKATNSDLEGWEEF